ncbi:molybdopterin-binding protein [Metabacillus arenae]|uniref:Peptidyl-prolyl cis-trans isomerase n=1 Tax=Metabacillus arenae TaxID=2771434 RepID=A0A926RWM0_9BACI|nr:peptidyl-prolyl cis-trans isomerase [Metabacillus arenae]MBD1380943.1 peptidyl-prolyl cis-trans isomerase [Metabacillus arenae]
MESIVIIKGNVKHVITLDPGVWIFDDRKVDLTTYFDQHPLDTKDDQLEAYTREVSKHWEREIREGAIYPPTLKTERKFEKEKVLNGTFGISLGPFLKNAEPKEDAKFVVFQTQKEAIKIPITDAENMILGFSKSGKPLLEDGPIHAYYHDGRNKLNPITHIREIKVI